MGDRRGLPGSLPSSTTEQRTQRAKEAPEPTSFLTFSSIAPHALSLETVRPGVYRSVLLWTPAAQRRVYGGQLVAHVVEASYRTVDERVLCIHSLRVTFLRRGDSRPQSGPIEYRVESLREGNSFCVRHVRATQGDRTLLLAVAGFHRAEPAGVRHELARPYFIEGGLHKAAVAAAFDARLAALLKEREDRLADTDAAGDVVPNAADSSSSSAKAGMGVAVEYLSRVATAAASVPLRSTVPEDVWMRLEEGAIPRLIEESGIPASRAHLIVSCWLSDFIVAFASLLPHGMPNPNLNMIASLDHAIYFHSPHRVKVDDWFTYEVHSSWAGNNRGLNHGRMNGRDGKLWMSVTQETVLRMKRGYVSKL